MPDGINGCQLFWPSRPIIIPHLSATVTRPWPSMNTKRLYRRWKRKYLKGLKGIARNLKVCRRTGSPEAVHELRVDIRRTRLLALIGRAIIGRKRALAFRAWAQGIADSLSPVRDYDVMIEWVSPIYKRPEVIRSLRASRGRAWANARHSLERMPKDKWSELTDLEVTREKRRQLAARYKKVCTATRQLIEVDARAFNHLDPNGRHNFRRALRRMRYLQDLTPKVRAEQEDLGKLQTMLGELQNAEAMKGLLKNGQRQLAHRRAMMRHLNRYEAESYPRCRRSLKGVVRSLDWR